MTVGIVKHPCEYFPEYFKASQVSTAIPSCERLPIKLGLYIVVIGTALKYLFATATTYVETRLKCLLLVQEPNSENCFDFSCNPCKKAIIVTDTTI